MSLAGTWVLLIESVTYGTQLVRVFVPETTRVLVPEIAFHESSPAISNLVLILIPVRIMARALYYETVSSY